MTIKKGGFSMLKKLLSVVAFMSLFAASAFAVEGEAAASGSGLAALAAGLGIGIAVLGGALGQSKAAASALEGMSRNPAASGKLLVPMIIALALIESLVLFAFLIAFFLQGKVPG